MGKAKQLKTCPKCGHRGPIEKDFGWRVRNGRYDAQSHCRSCRGGAKKLDKAVNSLSEAVASLANLAKRAAAYADVYAPKPSLADTKMIQAAGLMGAKTEPRAVIQPVTVERPVIVTDDLEMTRAEYARAYPGDKAGNQRSWRFCVTRLMKKLGDAAVLTDQAKEKLEGK